MLHQDLEDVINDTVETNWIVVIEGSSIIHFYESMDTLKEDGEEFVTVVRSDSGEVVYLSSNATVETGTVDEVSDLLQDKI